MLILVLIGVYLVFKVTTSCEKLHQDNGRSTERYVILWDVVKLYKILEIEVISTQRDNKQNIQNPCKLSVCRGFLYPIPSIWCLFGVCSVKICSIRLAVLIRELSKTAV